MIQKTYQHIAAAAMALLLFAGSVQAQTVSAPRMLSYQGVLSSTGTAGNDTAGNRLLKVTLYGDANGTTKLWQSTMNTPVDANGVFNCMLGSVDNPLPPPTVMDRAIWLGVSIDNAPELRPLSEVSASAYAINVADSSITTAKIAEGAVTWDKMGTDYVPYIRVNGDKVTTGHNSINFTGSEGMMVDYDSTTMSLIFHPDTALLAGTGGKGGVNTLSVPGTTPWVAGGNVNIGVPTNFVGTNDTSSALEIHLEDGSGGTSTPNNVRIAHYQFETVSPNITMGFGSGSLTGNLIGNAWVHGAPLPHGSAITGGGEFGAVNTITGNYDLIGEGVSNTVRSNYSSLTGGDDNAIDTLADASFLGGGLNNMIEDFGPGVFVGDTIVLGGNVLGGGRNNAIKGALGAIAGGEGNILDSYVNFSFIGAGETNLITGSSVVFSGIVAGSTNIITNSNSIIGAGGFNNITSVGAGIVAGYEDTNNAEYSVIGAGNLNATSASASSSFIGAGTFNYTDAHETFVGAGTSDSVQAFESGAVAGQNAKIDTLSSYSFIGAGYYNLIDTNAPYSVIGGGNQNTAQSTGTVIGGGDLNIVAPSSQYSFIGSGAINVIDTSSPYSVIGGGDSNRIANSASNTFIGGGSYNYAGGSGDVIAGGDTNSIDAAGSSPVEYDAIGGGNDNHIVQADVDNVPTPTIYSGIAAGHLNITREYASFVGGGEKNEAFEEWSAVLGGDTNINLSPYSVIGGGQGNLVFTSSPWSGIWGGQGNFEGDELSAIVGGDSNMIIKPGPLFPAHSSFIGGGSDNTINAVWGVIGGGDTNLIGKIDSFAAIGGGLKNLIEANNAPYAAIPGGDSLTANSFAQAVVGYNNIASGTFTHGNPHSGSDLPLFIVGNGDNSSSRSDAFTVSYDGHATAFQNLPTTGTGTITGSTYEDNTIVAWGDEGAAGAFFHGIGCTVTPLGAGVYTITLTVTDPGGAHAFVNQDAAIVVTPTENAAGGPALVTVTPLLVPGNTFTVTTFSWSTGLPTNTIGFQFHVVLH